jgi:hypothetical protein
MWPGWERRHDPEVAGDKDARRSAGTAHQGRYLHGGDEAVMGLVPDGH